MRRVFRGGFPDVGSQLFFGFDDLFNLGRQT